MFKNNEDNEMASMLARLAEGEAIIRGKDSFKARKKAVDDFYNCKGYKSVVETINGLNPSNYQISSAYKEIRQNVCSAKNKAFSEGNLGFNELDELQKEENRIFSQRLLYRTWKK